MTKHVLPIVNVIWMVHASCVRKDTMAASVEVNVTLTVLMGAKRRVVTVMNATRINMGDSVKTVQTNVMESVIHKMVIALVAKVDIMDASVKLHVQVDVVDSVICNLGTVSVVKQDIMELSVKPHVQMDA